MVILPSGTMVALALLAWLYPAPASAQTTTLEQTTLEQQTDDQQMDDQQDGQFEEAQAQTRVMAPSEITQPGGGNMMAPGSNLPPSVAPPPMQQGTANMLPAGAQAQPNGTRQAPQQQIPVAPAPTPYEVDGQGAPPPSGAPMPGQ